MIRRLQTTSNDDIASTNCHNITDLPSRNGGHSQILRSFSALFRFRLNSIIMDSPNTITGWRRYFSMGPLAFLLMFGFLISGNVVNDLIVYQTCKTIAGLDISECNMLHENSTNKEAIKNISDKVQPLTETFYITRLFIELIFPSFLALFLGPWSDKNGRKPLLLIPFIGQVLFFASMAVLSTLDVNPYWLLLPSIPLSLSGGMLPIFMTLFCYITDITDKNNRSWHMAVLNTCIYIGALAGLMVGPIVFAKFGYYTVFTMSSAVAIVAVAHIIFFVEETISSKNGRAYGKFFNWSAVKDTFSIVTRKREGYDRYLTCCCIAVIALHVMATEGNFTLVYLFASKKLGWNVEDFSLYLGTHMIVMVFGMLLLIRIAGSVLKIPDTAIIIISCLSGGAEHITRAFVSSPWHMYAASGLGMFNSATIPLVRSVMSKSVSENDVGKIFSVSMVTEMIFPVASSSVYISIYSRTLNMYPSPVWFLPFAIALIMIVLAVIIEKRWRKRKIPVYSSVKQNDKIFLGADDVQKIHSIPAD